MACAGGFERLRPGAIQPCKLKSKLSNSKDGSAHNAWPGAALAPSIPGGRHSRTPSVRQVHAGAAAPGQTLRIGYLELTPFVSDEVRAHEGAKFDGRKHWLRGGFPRSWEGYVVEQVAGTAGREWELFFYRTSAGAECDLVLRRGRRTLAAECKLASAPEPSRGFWHALEDLKPERSWIVAPVAEAYPIERSVRVTPLAAFLQELSRMAK